MNNNIQDQKVTPFLKLRGKHADVYSIDKLDDGTLIISPLKPQIDIFETLTLRDTNSNDICEINISELFIDALVEAVERTKIGGAEEANHTKLIKEGGRAAVDAFIDSKIIFREMSECFPKTDSDNRAYMPPNSDEIISDRKTKDAIIGSLKEQIIERKKVVGENPEEGVDG